MQSSGSDTIAIAKSSKFVLIEATTSEVFATIKMQGRLQGFVSGFYFFAVVTEKGVIVLDCNGRCKDFIPSSFGVLDLDFHPTLPIVAIYFKDGGLLLRDFNESRMLLSVNNEPVECPQLRFSDDGRLFTEILGNSVVIAFNRFCQPLSIIWDQDDAQYMSTFYSSVYSEHIEFNDGIISVWNHPGGTCLRKLDQKLDEYEIHPNEHLIAGIPVDGKIHVWSTKTLKVQRIIDFPEARPSIQFGRRDVLYVAGGQPMQLYLYNVRHGATEPPKIIQCGDYAGFCIGQSSI